MKVSENLAVRRSTGLLNNISFIHLSPCIIRNKIDFTSYKHMCISTCKHTQNIIIYLITIRYYYTSLSLWIVVTMTRKGLIKIKSDRSKFECEVGIFFNGLHLLFSLSYSTVVLYIGIMKVWGFWPEIITPKPA